MSESVSETPLLDVINERKRTLTALDRCDRCGAQAYVHVKVLAGGELLFCAHHSRTHAEVLENPECIEILADERWVLEEEAAAYKIPGGV